MGQEKEENAFTPVKQVMTTLNMKEHKALRLKMAIEGIPRQRDAIKDAINKWSGFQDGGKNG